MARPYRIYRKAKELEGDGGGTGLDDYIERLLKLIPADVTAGYLVVRELGPDIWKGIWPVLFLLVAIAIRALGTRDPKKPQWLAVAIASVAFVFWVYATGGHFLGIQLDSGVVSGFLVIFTIIIPYVYKGD